MNCTYSGAGLKTLRWRQASSSFNQNVIPMNRDSMIRDSIPGRVLIGVSAFTIWLLTAHEGRCAQPSTPSPAKHVKVYAEPGRFGGWPANHGIWSWGDEILVGFSSGYFKDNGPDRHAIDHDRPEEHLLARSQNGGETWTIENPSEHGALIPAGPALHGITPSGLQEPPWKDCSGGINFMDPDFALTVRMTDANAGISRFSYSVDRGHTWRRTLPATPLRPTGNRGADGLSGHG